MTYIEIFNELCILGVAYLLFLLTDYIPLKEIQYNAGWLIISLTILNISVNFGLICFTTFKGIKKLCMKYNYKVEPVSSEKYV